MAEPTISIAIPTYNRRELLQKTMQGMTGQQTGDEFTYEIIVIDDASTDDTGEVVSEISRRSTVPVRYIREKGVGYTGVLNRAVREFRGEWLAFFDDDQHTHFTWLRELYNVACSRNAEMVGGPIILDLPEETLASIGPVCRDLYGESPDVRNPELYAEKPPLPSGGNRLVHRRVFAKIGAFDEAMLTGGCDRDFLLRALEAGVVMGWSPEAAGYHLIPPERITYRHVKWYSLQWGCSFAYIDRKHRGLARTAFFCLARIAQALLINLPLLVWALIRRDRAAILDRQALLWRAVGYTRKTLQMLAPRLFAQDDFFSRVEFRRARENT